MINSKISLLPDLEEITIAGKYNAQVPWVIALLIFLLVIVLAASSSITRTLVRWQDDISHHFTIEIPVQHEKDAQVVDAVKNFLNQVPGIAHVEVVESQDMHNLLEPLVGQADWAKDLQLPILIDVATLPDVVIDVHTLTRHLRQIVAGIRVESHGRWQGMLSSISWVLQSATYLIASLIAAAVMVTISLVSRSNFVVHQGIVDILRLLGAEKNMIARHYQRSAFVLALKGSFIGVLIAVPFLFFGHGVGTIVGFPAIFRLIPDIQTILVITIIPIAAACLSLFVARFAVFRALNRMEP